MVLGTLCALWQPSSCNSIVHVIWCIQRNISFYLRIDVIYLHKVTKKSYKNIIDFQVKSSFCAYTVPNMQATNYVFYRKIGSVLNSS